MAEEISMSITYLLLCGFGLVSGSCPPVGSYECIEIDRYSGRQYATCLTDDYIQTFSGYKHHCEDRTATYCWYQCMIESHNKNDGPVTPDCSCDTATRPPEDELPAECNSPSGSDCNWYTDCLERRYPCQNDPASYAVAFAQKFCWLYTKHYNKFSTVGQHWVDAVRKCLQVKLVPTLRPGQHKTCAELKEFAFDTHSGCYLNPDNGQNSICDVQGKDYFAVVWTLAEGFGSLLLQDKELFKKAMWPTFQQILSVGTGCVTKWTYKGIMIVVNFVNDIYGDDRLNIGRRRRSLDTQTDAMTDVVFDVTNQISNTMKWDEGNLMWFGFPILPSMENTEQEENTTYTTLQVRIVLESKALYDLNAINITETNVSAAIEDLSNAIVNGDFKFNLGEGVNATLYKVCTDLNCTVSTFEAVPENLRTIPTGDTEDGFPNAIAIGIGVLTAVVLLVAVAVYLYRRTR